MFIVCVGFSLPFDQHVRDSGGVWHLPRLCIPSSGALVLCVSAFIFPKFSSACYCSSPEVAFPFLGPLFRPIMNRTSIGKSFDFLVDSASKIVDTRRKDPSSALVSPTYALCACVVIG